MYTLFRNKWTYQYCVFGTESVCHIVLHKAEDQALFFSLELFLKIWKQARKNVLRFAYAIVIKTETDTSVLLLETLVYILHHAAQSNSEYYAVMEPEKGAKTSNSETRKQSSVESRRKGKIESISNNHFDKHT